MKASFRRTLISLVTFLGGIYFFLEFILPKKLGEFEFGRYNDQISIGFTVVGAMAIGLGLINILRVHGTVVLKTSRGWSNSLALLLGLLIMLTMGAIDFIKSEHSVSAWKQFGDLGDFLDRVVKEGENAPLSVPARLDSLAGALKGTLAAIHEGGSYLAPPEAKEELASSSKELELNIKEAVEQSTNLARIYERFPRDNSQVPSLVLAIKQNLKSSGEHAKLLATYHYEQSRAKKYSHLLENGFFFPLGAAMFSLLAFYIASAAYRSFRIKSLEAFIMMITAVVVMLGQIPHGPIYVWDKLPQLRLWLLQNISTPAFRAVYFGAAIAGLAMSVRMWLSLEKSPLGSTEE